MVRTWRGLYPAVDCDGLMMMMMMMKGIALVQYYIHTYHSRFIPEGVAELSQIFLRDTHVLLKLVSYEEHSRRDRW
jgi:hypothetical protein